MTGFKKFVHGGVLLTVGTQVVVDIALEVGTAQQTISVEGQVLKSTLLHRRSGI